MEHDRSFCVARLSCGKQSSTQPFNTNKHWVTISNTNEKICWFAIHPDLYIDKLLIPFPIGNMAFLNNWRTQMYIVQKSNSADSNASNVYSTI